MLSSVVEMIFLDTDEYLFPVDVRRSAHEALRRAEQLSPNGWCTSCRVPTVSRINQS
jgi:hypothetical protein